MTTQERFSLLLLHCSLLSRDSIIGKRAGRFQHTSSERQGSAMRLIVKGKPLLMLAGETGIRAQATWNT